jgi:hypothetical protein
LVAILGQIRHDLAQILGPEEIRAACRAENHSWRQRRLGPVQTIHLFILEEKKGRKRGQENGIKSDITDNIPRSYDYK